MSVTDLETIQPMCLKPDFIRKAKMVLLKQCIRLFRSIHKVEFQLFIFQKCEIRNFCYACSLKLLIRLSWFFFPLKEYIVELVLNLILIQLIKSYKFYKHGKNTDVCSPTVMRPYHLTVTAAEIISIHIIDHTVSGNVFFLLHSWNAAKSLYLCTYRKNSKYCLSVSIKIKKLIIKQNFPFF